MGSEWKTIESAPRDGRVILCTGHDKADKHLCVESMKWWGTEFGWLEGDCPRDQPSHWMPLPPPPETDQ